MFNFTKLLGWIVNDKSYLCTGACYLALLTLTYLAIGRGMQKAVGADGENNKDLKRADDAMMRLFVWSMTVLVICFLCRPTK